MSLEVDRVIVFAGRMGLGESELARWCDRFGARAMQCPRGRHGNTYGWKVMLKTGKQHLEGLRDGRVIYIGNERVDEVTTHPAFCRAAATAAAIY